MSHVFFTDRDLGKRLPELLRAAGIHVERHSDHFPDTAADERWLTVVGREGWFVLTHDKRIRYKVNERDAVLRSGVGLFVLVGKAPLAAHAQNFIATLPLVEQFIASNPRPFIAKIYLPGPASAKAPGAAHGHGRVERWL